MKILRQYHKSYTDALAKVHIRHRTQLIHGVLMQKYWQSGNMCAESENKCARVSLAFHLKRLLPSAAAMKERKGFTASRRQFAALTSRAIREHARGKKMKSNGIRV
jgi:hypothetical protein